MRSLKKDMKGRDAALAVIALCLCVSAANCQTRTAPALELDNNWTGVQNFKIANGVMYASQYSGADAGAKISTAITAASSSGAVIWADLSSSPVISSDITSAVTKKIDLYLSDATWSVTSDLTVPPNVTLHFSSGSILSVASGKTLKMRSIPEAGPWQIFSGSGTVSFETYTPTVGATIETRARELLPEWWGAVPDNSTDSSAALQAAVTAGGNSQIPVKLSGLYYTGTTTITISKSETKIYGNSTGLRAGIRYGGTGIALRIYNSGSPVYDTILKDLFIYSTSGTTATTGLSAEYASQFKFDNIWVNSGGNVAGGITNCYKFSKSGIGEIIYPTAEFCTNGIYFDYDSFTNSSINIRGGNLWHNQEPLVFIGASNISVDGTWIEWGNDAFLLDNNGTDAAGGSVEQLQLKNVRFINGPTSPFQGGYIWRAAKSNGARNQGISGLSIQDCWFYQQSTAAGTVVSAPIVIASGVGYGSDLPISMKRLLIRGGQTNLISNGSASLSLEIEDGNFGKDVVIGGNYADSAVFTGAGANVLLKRNSAATFSSSTGITAGSYVSVGTNPASTGNIRLPNLGYIYGRNAANNADVVMWVTDTNNNVLSGTNVVPGSDGNDLGTTASRWDAFLKDTTSYGNFKIGQNGTALTFHASGTASLDYDLSAAGITCQDLTITVTGAATGDTVTLGLPDALASTAGVGFSAWVSAADTVKVRACDWTSGNPNPAAATIRADVWHH